MSVYIVTKENRLIEYAPTSRGGSMWIANEGSWYKIYQRDCPCTECSNPKHENFIARVQNSSILSIGFYRPVAIEGRLLTYSEKSNLTSIAEWLEKKKNLPKKVSGKTEILKVLAK